MTFFDLIWFDDYDCVGMILCNWMSCDDDEQLFGDEHYLFSVENKTNLIFVFRSFDGTDFVSRSSARRDAER